MRIGAALFLIALGAILDFAVKVNNSHGFNINTIGVILMIVGAIGLIAEVIFMTTRRRTDVVHQGPAGTNRTTYVDSPPPSY
jgi:membrane-bound ClpP family serine protease